MRESELLKIRDKAELHVATGDTVRIFLVSVQDITDDGIFVDRPIIDRSLLPSTTATEIMLVYTRNDATYRFRTKVMSEQYLGRLPVLMVEHPKELERVQRQNYFRLNITLPVEYQQRKLLELNKNGSSG